MVGGEEARMSRPCFSLPLQAHRCLTGPVLAWRRAGVGDWTTEVVCSGGGGEGCGQGYVRLLVTRRLSALRGPGGGVREVSRVRRCSGEKGEQPG